MSPEPNPLFEAFQPQPAGEVTEVPKSNGNKRGRKAAAPKGEKAPKELKAAKAPRKKREAKPRTASKVPKYALSKILSATTGLKEADMKFFEALLANLHALNKATRARILTAVGKVFQ